MKYELYIPGKSFSKDIKSKNLPKVGETIIYEDKKRSEPCFLKLMVTKISHKVLIDYSGQTSTTYVYTKKLND